MTSESGIFSRDPKNVQLNPNTYSNTMVKSYLSPKTIIKPSMIGGLGTFAQLDIKRGEIVFVKGGHIVTRDELFYSKQISS